MATKGASGSSKVGLYVVLGVVVVGAAGAFWYMSRDDTAGTRFQPVADDGQAYQEPEQDQPQKRTARPVPTKTIERERPTAPKRPTAKPEGNKPKPTRRPKPKAPTKINTSPRA